MNQINLYWSTYINIEKEVIDLANKLHFNDEQLGVYSMYIGELLIRCSVEIESISKELYYKYGGIDKVNKKNIKQNLYFDKDCLKFLDEKLNICKKQIIISAYNMYFQDEKNKYLQPLNKVYEKGKCDWNVAYQAVKHDRNNSYNLATIKNLLNALGSLFILNIYYKFEKKYLGIDDFKKHNSDENSIIFSPYILDTTSACKMYLNPSYQTELVEKSILIYRFVHKSFFECLLGLFKDDFITKNNMNNSPTVQEFLVKYPEYAGKPNIDILLAMTENNVSIFPVVKTSQHEVDAWIKGSTELILNINTPIYTISNEEEVELQKYIF